MILDVERILLSILCLQQLIHQTDGPTNHATANRDVHSRATNHSAATDGPTNQATANRDVHSRSTNHSAATDEPTNQNTANSTTTDGLTNHSAAIKPQDVNSTLNNQGTGSENTHSSLNLVSPDIYQQDCLRDHLQPLDFQLSNSQSLLQDSQSSESLSFQPFDSLPGNLKLSNSLLRGSQPTDSIHENQNVLGDNSQSSESLFDSLEMFSSSENSQSNPKTFPFLLGDTQNRLPAVNTQSSVGLHNKTDELDSGDDEDVECVLAELAGHLGVQLDLLRQYLFNNEVNIFYERLDDISLSPSFRKCISKSCLLMGTRFTEILK